MCGIIGIIGPQNTKTSYWAAKDAYNALITLQHRGQDAAGIFTFDEEKQQYQEHKHLGLIANVFTRDSLKSLTGNMAIAHTRYATAGGNDISDLQPMSIDTPYAIAMAHNGNLVNYHELTRLITEEWNQQISTSNDLELLLRLWSTFLYEQSHVFDFESAQKATKKLFDTVDGAYSVVALIPGEGLLGFRDPNGIRPLVLGVSKDGSHCLASETTALQFLGYQFLRDIKPGELICIDTQGNIQSTQVTNKISSPCMFEWVYFAGASGTMEQISVYGSRLKLGEVLSQKVQQHIAEGRIEADVVAPVPETSRPASIALAESLSIPYREIFIKSRYIQRSFILNTQEERDNAIQHKLSPIVSEIKGKNILLVDDSVVRGTTSRAIIALLKKNGAKRISLAITCPPIRFPCYYGIDFPDPSVLVATNRTEEEIAKWIGVDQVIYIDEQDLKEAIGKENLCMGCLNGTYPTKIRGYDEFRKHRSAK